MYFQTTNKIYRYYDGRIGAIDADSKENSSVINDEVFFYGDEGLYVIKGSRPVLLPHSKELVGRSPGSVFAMPYKDNKILIATANNGFLIYDLEIVQKNGSFLVDLANENIQSTITKAFPTEIDEYILHNKLSHWARLDNSLFAFSTSRGDIIIMDGAGKLVQIINNNKRNFDVTFIVLKRSR
ncbi:MAG: hypothetical protein GY861_06565 [bacterium]|nr:hypothetical protein [bacterium]